MLRALSQAIYFFSAARAKRQQGFFLAGVLAAAALSLAAAVMLGSAVSRLLPLWQELQARRQLQDAARYIFINMERELGVNSTAIALSRSGGYPLADCQSIGAAKTVRFYYNTSYQGIYKRTTKLLKGNSGVNPACLPGYTVENWRLRRLGDNAVCLQFALRRDTYRGSFSHVIYCVNGRVSGDG